MVSCLAWAVPPTPKAIQALEGILTYDGLIELHDDAMVLLPQGQLMMRSVAMAFDAYLGSAQQERFSRTI